VEAPFLTSHELIRPWRRATFVAGAIAAVELVLLLVAGMLLLAKPVAHVIRNEAVAVATAKPAAREAKALRKAIKRMNTPVGTARPRGHMRIMVFNGNGRQGAAGAEAGHLSGLGYKIAGTTNATHQNYATTVVMYRPGFRAEGLRLARDLGVKVVGPLDGIAASSLRGGQLAVVVGARS